MAKKRSMFPLFRSMASEAQPLSVDGWARLAMQYGGHVYPLTGRGVAGNSETIENDFRGYVEQIMKSDGIVWACMAARRHVFAQARFMFQEITGGKPDELVWDNALRLFEDPYPEGTPKGSTLELLVEALMDADLAGTHYTLRKDSDRPGGKSWIERLRPDWVEVILTKPPEEAKRSDIRGHVYRPGGTNDRGKWEIYPIDGSKGRISMWSPEPDPLANYRGMSWLTPVLREIMADKAASAHKLKFFENAATPAYAVSFKESVTKEQFEEFMEIMNRDKTGIDAAYETLYLGGGADVTVLGANLQQMDFKVTQGHGETRIAAAARVHPVIVGLSEGMQGSSLNAGNYSAAKRSFAEGPMQYLWQSISGAYSNLIDEPVNKRLWFDTRHIAFLREDKRELAEIQKQESTTITQLTREGYKPESVIEAVITGDWTMLQHNGLYSVQLQPPNPEGTKTAPAKKEDSDDE